MARSSILSLVNQMARDSARRQRQAEAERRRDHREQLRHQKAALRARVQAAKDAKQAYLDAKTAEAEDATEAIVTQVEEFSSIMEHTLQVNDTVTFDSLLIKDDFPPLTPSTTQEELEPTIDSFLGAVKNPGILGKLLPMLRKQYQQKLEQAKAKFQREYARWTDRQSKRQSFLQGEKEAYESRKREHDQKVAARNQEVHDFIEAYRAADPKAIVGYCSMVLERSEYPEGFPQEFRVAYVPESKQLVVEYELPAPGIIPTDVEHRYVRSRDEIQTKPRKPAEIRDLYQDIVSSVTLRTCHELFEADQGQHIDVLAFNGFVQTVDRATGKDIRPCLVTLRVTRERFLEIELSRVEKAVCLRNLGAQVSPRPAEVQPVKPIVEFDMVDRRFVEQSDILSDLESRPNLMDLDPFEFENLIGNLFKQMGLETKLTRASRDGGVDVVAYDLRPVLGGKVVIQAKRWKNTVDVAAVRDLFGTMMNEGANKGILVSTSGFGPASFEFAKDKPIELIEGSKLLYLLDECGVKARIVFPDDWKGD